MCFCFCSNSDHHTIIGNNLTTQQMNKDNLVLSLTPAYVTLTSLSLLLVNEFYGETLNVTHQSSVMNVVVEQHEP